MGDSKKDCRPWQDNLTIIQIYITSSFKGWGKDANLSNCETTRLITEGMAHKQCTLIDKVEGKD